MKRFTLQLLIFAAMLIGFACQDAVGKTRQPKPFLKTRVEKEKVVEGERLIYEVELYSPVSTIAGVEMAAPPDFCGLPSKQSAPDASLEEVTVDGIPYYSAVIDRYFLGFNHKGKFSLKGGDYRLGLSHPVQYEDPFWGPRLGNEVEVVNLTAPGLTVKVNPLPTDGRPEDFSGAVGNFEISASLPQGEIRKNEDACLIINISGEGDLTNTTLPEMMKFFPEGLKFKSMTDTRSHYIKKGTLGSEIEIECIFSPKNIGEFVLKDISFNFFNSTTGKYETVTAPEITVEVADDDSKSTSPVIMDV